MNKSIHETGAVGRREFLVASAMAAAGFAGVARGAGTESLAGGMPMIQLGAHRVSRLVVGANPINGYSYMGSHTDQHMREYFTVERTTEFLANCEKQGINTHQSSGLAGSKSLEAMKTLRARGSKMHYISLHAGRETIKETIEQTGAIALAHHGQVTDSLFAEGKSQTVRDYVKAVRDAGALAGVSAHNPDCIKRIADEGWDVDFFMTCFFFITRSKFPGRGEKDATPSLELSYPFFRDDPKVMTAVIRQVKQPCLAFKILGAGRLCQNAAAVRKAFQFAFENIKPIDGVIVGMYPRFQDEVTANAQHTREVGRIG